MENEEMICNIKETKTKLNKRKKEIDAKINKLEYILIDAQEELKQLKEKRPLIYALQKEFDQLECSVGDGKLVDRTDRIPDKINFYLSQNYKNKTTSCTNANINGNYSLVIVFQHKLDKDMAKTIIEDLCNRSFFVEGKHSGYNIVLTYAKKYRSQPKQSLKVRSQVSSIYNRLHKL